jgi:peptidyl-prolyl cis-trans isomerase D
MLDTMRANRRNILTALLFGIIIFVFVVSFGPGSQGCQGAQSGGGGSHEVASVNGKSISAADFEQQYAQMFRMYQQQAGEAFTQELADQLGLRQNAVEQLVVRELILQEAQRHGLLVTDEELERSIKDSPSFQSGGHFDHEYYTRATTSAYGSPGRFEARMREDLLVQKMATLVRQGAKVAPDEIKRAWMAESDRVNLEVVRFPIEAAAAETKPTDAEVQAYAAANAQKVEAAYKANPAAFQKEKRVRARHILVKADSNGQDAAAQQKAQQILERARKGEDFAKLARETSQDERSREQGGDLGEFGRGVMAKPFEDAAFALKAGEVGGPVRTQFGYHVIKVEGVEESGGGSLDEARPAVARKLLSDERATALAKKKAEAALAALKAGRSFADVFPAPGAKSTPVTLGGKVLQPAETGLFSPVASGSVPRLGEAPMVAAAAAGAKGPGLLPQVYDTPQGPVVARVKERQRPDESQFSAKEGEIAERLRTRREGEIEQAWVAALRQQADVKVNASLLGTSNTATQ